jgi:hypothetical protein
MISRILIAVPILFMSIGCGAEEEQENTGICGDWIETTVDFEATVWSPQVEAPVVGAELYCEGEDSPRATSDEAGVLQFTLTTFESTGGCGYEDCNDITVEPPLSSALVATTLDFDEANGQTIDLMYAPD